MHHVLLWVLVTIGNGNPTIFSQPVDTQDACMALDHAQRMAYPEKILDAHCVSIGAWQRDAFAKSEEAED